MPTKIEQGCQNCRSFDILVLLNNEKQILIYDLLATSTLNYMYYTIQILLCQYIISKKSKFFEGIFWNFSNC